MTHRRHATGLVAAGLLAAGALAVPAARAATPGPPAAVPPVPSAPATRAAQPKPLPVARPRVPAPFASQVDAIGTTTYAGAYAGQQAAPSGRLIIYAVASSAAAFLAAVRSAAARSPGASYAVKPVAHSWAQLDGLTQTIASQAARLRVQGVRLAQWGPDPASNTVAITLQHYTPAAARALAARYGTGMVSVSRASRPALFTSYADRFSDFPPFYGGDYIWNNAGVNCTSGLAFVAHRSGNTYSLTAGHCGGRSWYTNTSTPYLFGRTSTNYLRSGYDIESVRSDAAGLVWSNTSTSYGVVGAISPSAGQRVSFDGAITGQVRGVTILHTNVCLEINYGGTEYTACHIAIAEKQGTTVCEQGDSGAPVYQHTAANFNNVEAVGIFVAGYGPARSFLCAYEMIGPVLAKVHGTIAEG